MTALMSSRHRKVLAALTLAFGGAFLAGGLLGGLGAAASYAAGLPPLWLMVAASTVLTGAALWGTLPYWRRIDEMAREAHKSSFFWGGSLALGMLGGPAALILALGDLPRFRLAPVEIGFASGVVAMGLLQCAVYLVFWAVWWLRRR